MHSTRSVATRTGIAGGVAFLIHVVTPNSGSYPFIWPALTGAAAFWIATSDDAARRIRRGILATIVAGIIIGLIRFVGSTLTVFALSLPAMRPITESLGIGGRGIDPISWTPDSL